MEAQRSETMQIRRAHSAPRLVKDASQCSSADTSGLVASPLSTRESSPASFGDECVSLKPKSRAQFDCNICFDAAREPVVTQCGHLYCWACLYHWLTSPSIVTDPTCPTCKSGCEIPSLIPIYGRGPPSPPRSRSSSQSTPASKKAPRALRLTDALLLPYLKSPPPTSNILPPRPHAKRLPPRSTLQNSPFFMLLQSAQRHYPFLPEGAFLPVPQGGATRFGKTHLFMLILAIWAALFKMMADSGRSWRTFSAFDSMGSTGMNVIGANGAEGETVGRFGLILGMFLGFGLLWYRSRHANGVMA